MSVATALEWGRVEVYRVEEGKSREVECSKDLDSPVGLSLGAEGLRLRPLGTEKAKTERLWALSSLRALPLTERSVAVRVGGQGSFVLAFGSGDESAAFEKGLEAAAASSSASAPSALVPGPKSLFDSRTEDASAQQYFQFYGYLSQQQNMLQDYVRTATYQQAIVTNLGDFKGKVVLDVGAGSGILSFFAAQAGAARVYAVEASTMAVHCRDLVRANGLQDRITVVAGKVEEISLPEQVDVIISEPMGYMLLNERMLESYLHAKKFLKPGGKMYPTRGDLHMAPFTDEALYLEQTGKAAFWAQGAFHGVDLASLRPQALLEYFRQPVVDTFHVAILTAPSHKWEVDFLTCPEEGLVHIDIPVSYTIATTAHIHGMAFWFDVAFIGGVQTVWLSTAPTEPLTHWYQVRCLFPTPLLGKAGDTATGRVRLVGNARQSYDVHIALEIDGVRVENTLDLKNPFFRYGGQVVVPPAGTQVSDVSPSDAYWAQAAQTSQAAGPYAASLPQGFGQPAQDAIAQLADPPVAQPSQTFAQPPATATALIAPVGWKPSSEPVRRSGESLVVHPMTIGSRGGGPKADAALWPARSLHGSTTQFHIPAPRVSHAPVNVLESIVEKQTELGPDWLGKLTEEAEGGRPAAGDLIGFPAPEQAKAPRKALVPVSSAPSTPFPVLHPFSSPPPPLPLASSGAPRPLALFPAFSQAQAQPHGQTEPRSRLFPSVSYAPPPGALRVLQPQATAAPFTPASAAPPPVPGSPDPYAAVFTRQARVGGVPMLGMVGSGNGEGDPRGASTRSFPNAYAPH